MFVSNFDLAFRKTQVWRSRRRLGEVVSDQFANRKRKLSKLRRLPSWRRWLERLALRWLFQTRGRPRPAREYSLFLSFRVPILYVYDEKVSFYNVRFIMNSYDICYRSHSSNKTQGKGTCRRPIYGILWTRSYKELGHVGSTQIDFTRGCSSFWLVIYALKFVWLTRKYGWIIEETIEKVFNIIRKITYNSRLWDWDVTIFKHLRDHQGEMDGGLGGQVMGSVSIHKTRDL